MSERANEIGRARCPVCANTKARLRVSASGLPYLHCGACQVQVFARGDLSDELLRKLHIQDQQADPPAPPPRQLEPLGEKAQTTDDAGAWGVLGRWAS